jgi:hypothetical protein
MAAHRCDQACCATQGWLPFSLLKRKRQDPKASPTSRVLAGRPTTGEPGDAAPLQVRGKWLFRLLMATVVPFLVLALFEAVLREALRLRPSYREAHDHLGMEPGKGKAREFIARIGQLSAHGSVS